MIRITLHMTMNNIRLCDGPRPVVAVGLGPEHPPYHGLHAHSKYTWKLSNPVEKERVFQLLFPLFILQRNGNRCYWQEPHSLPILHTRKLEPRGKQWYSQVHAVAQRLSQD